MKWHPAAVFLALLPVIAPAADRPDVIDEELNTWVKPSPLPGGPVSPGLGQEAASLTTHSPIESSATAGTIRAAAVSRMPRSGSLTR